MALWHLCNILCGCLFHFLNTFPHSMQTTTIATIIATTIIINVEGESQLCLLLLEYLNHLKELINKARRTECPREDND